MTTLEEFDSGWQKGVWDFAIVTTDLNDTRYILNGPIDYRYCLNYGIITMEFFNCLSYSRHIEHEKKIKKIIKMEKYTKERTKKIDIDTQYFWSQNNETWHFDSDFYPQLIEFYKFKTNNKSINKKRKNDKEIYELALLMDSSRKYRKILSGPIIYESFLKNICFNSLEPYIKGDINVLRKYGQCIKKIDANKFFSIFNEDTQYGIEFNFDNLNLKKVELWNLHHDKKKNWEHYKSEQREEKYDIILITNRQKRIKYILNNAIMNCIESVIKFTSYHIYQSGDHEKLNEIAIKIKGFGVEKYKLWMEEEQNELKRSSFINLSLYETIKYKNFVFPDKMKPFKAFFYRFPDLKSKYQWRKFKNANNNLSGDNLNVTLITDNYNNCHYLPNEEKNIHIKMDSNMQIIPNNLIIDQQEQDEKDESDESIWRNMPLLALDIKSNKSSQSQVIHPLILSNTNSNITDYDASNNNNLSPKCHEMIINAAQYNSNWILTPKKKTNTLTSFFSNTTPDFAPNTVPENQELEINRLLSISRNLTNTPYFKGEKPLPSFVTKNDPIPEVWDFYVQKYGFIPKNASQLHKFSRYSPDVDALKYVQAREQFSRRNAK